jgi:hypothetical protein
MTRIIRQPLRNPPRRVGIVHGFLRDGGVDFAKSVEAVIPQAGIPGKILVGMGWGNVEASHETKFP